MFLERAARLKCELKLKPFNSVSPKKGQILTTNKATFYLKRHLILKVIIVFNVLKEFEVVMVSLF
mgnify:CR=1 FL=1